MADLVVVNSRITAATFGKTFKRLDSLGIRPAVLYPVVNVDKFNLNFFFINQPFEKKKSIALAISSFAMLLRVLDEDVLPGFDLEKISLTTAVVAPWKLFGMGLCPNTA